MCDKPGRVITCEFSLNETIRLKESEFWRKVISNKIIVMLVTQGLPSFFLSRPVAKFSNICSRLRNGLGRLYGGWEVKREKEGLAWKVSVGETSLPFPLR